MEMMYNILLMVLIIGVFLGVLYMVGYFMGLETTTADGNRTIRKTPSMLDNVNKRLGIEN